jgi:hypothetical protein
VDVLHEHGRGDGIGAARIAVWAIWHRGVPQFSGVGPIHASASAAPGRRDGIRSGRHRGLAVTAGVGRAARS